MYQMKRFIDMEQSPLSFITLVCVQSVIQGVSKSLLESGAHKTPFLDTFTVCVGCWHMFIYCFSVFDSIGISLLS